MGKTAFVLGIVASVITGVVLSGNLIRKEVTATVDMVGVGHSCPTLGVRFDSPPDGLPREVTKCDCPVQPELQGASTPLHPPAELVPTAASLDLITISYTEFTSPMGGKKTSGLSYTLIKGPTKQTWTVSPAWSAYSPFVTLTAAPFLIGLALAVVLSFIPRKKGVAD